MRGRTGRERERWRKGGVWRRRDNDGGWKRNETEMTGGREEVEEVDNKCGKDREVERR